MIKFKPDVTAPKKPWPADEIITGLKEAIAVSEKVTAKPKRGPKAKAQPIQEPVSATEEKRRGRPTTGKARPQISLRIDADVLEHFRAMGAGWRSKINDALRKQIAKN